MLNRAFPIVVFSALAASFAAMPLFAEPTAERAKPAAPAPAPAPIPPPVPSRPIAPPRGGFPTPIGLTAFSSGPEAGEIGTDWVAGVNLFWKEGEPTKGTYDWSKLDAAILGVDHAGAAAIPVLVSRSTWGARPRPEGWVGGGGIEPVTVPSDLEAWSAFVSKVVERYDGDGTDDLAGLSHPVRAWQLMPDLTGTWAADAPSTIDYLDVTSKAVLASDPKAIRVLGSVTDTDLDLLAVDAQVMPGMILGDKKITRGVIRGVETLLTRVNFLGDVFRGAKESYAVVDVRHLTNSLAVTARLHFLHDYFLKNELPRKVFWSLYNAVPSLPGGMPDVHSVASEGVRAAFSAILGGCRRFAWPAHGSELPPAAVLAPYPLVDRAGQPQPVKGAMLEMAKRLRGLTSLELWKSPAGTPDVKVIGVDTTSVASFAVAWNEGKEPVDAQFDARGPVEAMNAVTSEKKLLTPKDGKVTLKIGPIPIYLTGLKKSM